MNEPITLTHGNVKADIDLQGAWLTRLQIADQDVLFARQSFTLPDGSTKVRGGSHVCFPNFGPGGASGLPQHGFARVSSWQVVEQSEAKVELLLESPAGDYAAVDTRLTYELLDDGINMALQVMNNGKTAASICPAFHPYFTTTATESVVGDKTYSHADLAEATFLGGSVERLQTGSRQLELEQQHLPEWVLWTDGLGDYVCLEPTAADNGFEDGSALQLQPGTRWDGSLSIHVKGKEE